MCTHAHSLSSTCFIHSLCPSLLPIGIPDSVEGSNDFDGDGIANFLDKDSVSFIAEGERVRRPRDRACGHMHCKATCAHRTFVSSEIAH